MSDLTVRPDVVMLDPSRPAYDGCRFVLDAALIALLVPVTLLAALLLLLVNPLANPGPLLFAQDRMGEGGRRFRALKFRTMTGTGEARGPFDPVESGRITRLGLFLRRTRIDELPQLVNVLRGEMAIIGPRPDMWDHARAYLDSVPGYRARVAVRPGMTGLAQVSVGYAADPVAVRRKVRADLTYIRCSGLRLDLWIVWCTVACVLRLKGS